MKRYFGILVLLAAAVVTAAIFWLYPQKQSPIQERPTKISSRQFAAVPQATQSTRPLTQLPASEPGKYDPILPQWEEWNRREKEDPKWEWKMPINFYGRVVDYDTGEPLEGVKIGVSWTDLSPEGGTRKTLFSDTLGNFRLTEITGKHLSINELKKSGYIRSNIGSQFSFEYAAFFAENYHLPDSNKPAIFRMKKVMDLEEPLIHREGEITVEVGRVGMVKLDPQTTVQVELIANGQLRERNWSARVKVSGGEIQMNMEEFPFIAPENGYQPSLTLDFESPKPGNWVGMYQGGQFYIKTADGRFGRIELKTVPGKTFMRYDFFLNLTPGSRNLEYNPKQKAKAP